MATRWTTASTPAIAGASVSGRVTSPIRISTPSRRSAGSRPMTISPAVGVRTSATTRWPTPSRAGTWWLPTKPLAPVTRMVDMAGA